jgi:nitrite reductase (cytochrome c-552)
MAEINDAFVRRRRRRFLILAGAAVLATIVGVALLMNIFERKQEARNPFYRVVELTDDTDDPAIWGKNFPLQYDDYKRTVDQVRTRYGGSEVEPRTPTKADPRSVVSQSKIEEDPRLKVMWAGYAFAKDFREERGHAYMLDDQTFTERVQVVKQPGTCIQCHGSVYVPYKKAGNGDLIAGFEKFNQMPFSEARKLVSHPVACMTVTIRAPCSCGSRALVLSKGCARSKPRRACRTTTSTSRRRARRCAPTSAASVT